jgi:hypothetical protein
MEPPRVLGSGLAADGRMTLSYVPGASPHPHAWPDSAAFEVGALLRRAHEAAASFEIPLNASWQGSWLRNITGSSDVVVGHGDAAPWNIVGTETSPRALVDWDLAGPIDRLIEVAYTVWLNAQLHDDDIAEMHGLPPAAVRARQARDIVDGYGLDSMRRAELVDRMIEVAVAGARADAVDHNITPDTDEAVTASGYPLLWSVTWRTRSAAWMQENRRLLSNAITA